MIHLTRRIGEGGKNVVAFQKCIVAKDFVNGRFRGKQVEDIAYPHPQSPYARFAAALPRLERDAIEQMPLHTRIICYPNSNRQPSGSEFVA